MHKLLLTFTALGSLAVGLATAEAAPVMPRVEAAPVVQTVQYYPGYYHRHDWHRHEWHRWHRWHHGY